MKPSKHELTVREQVADLISNLFPMNKPLAAAFRQIGHEALPFRPPFVPQSPVPWGRSGVWYVHGGSEWQGPCPGNAHSYFVQDRS